MDGAVIKGVLLAAGVINVCLSVYAYQRRREKAGAYSYAALVLAVAVYACAYAFEVNAASVEEIIFYLKFEYLGVSFFAALWLLMVLDYTGLEQWCRRPWKEILLGLAFLILLAHYTNGWHHLFYRNVGAHHQGMLLVADLAKGPLYWLHISYLYAAVAAGNFLLFRMYWRVDGKYRRQVACMVIGSLLPVAGNLIYLAGGSPAGIDLAPFMFALVSPLYAYGLFSFRLFDLAPIAREKVFASMQEAVLVVDGCERIIDFNPATRRIFPALSGPGVFLRDIAPAALLENWAENNSEFELCFDEKRYYHVRISSVVDQKARLLGKTVVFNDVTERVLLAEKLQRLAMVDEVTKLYSRRYLMQKSRELVEAGQAAFIMMDIDHFKNVNDCYGHAFGDLVLADIAGRCRLQAAGKGLVGRYGGEEFVFCLQTGDPKVAKALAETVRLAIAQRPVRFDNQSVSITASFGVAVACGHTVSVDELLYAADMALYQAKADGRNCVRLYGQ